MMNNKQLIGSLILSASFAAYAPAAMSDLQVKFAESAPKDRFSFSNVGACTLNNVVLTIDLADSRGKLIFDTTASGAGVEVFQPFETTNSSMKLVDRTSVVDGDTSLTIAIDSIGIDEIVSFTIDVDDTLPKSQLGMIRVTDSEMQGAKVTVSGQGLPASTAMFGTTSSMKLDLPDC